MIFAAATSDSFFPLPARDRALVRARIAAGGADAANLAALHLRQLAHSVNTVSRLDGCYPGSLRALDGRTCEPASRRHTLVEARRGEAHSGIVTKSLQQNFQKIAPDDPGHCA